MLTPRTALWRRRVPEGPFKTSICYWQDQPGRPPVVRLRALRAYRPAPASEGLPRRGDEAESGWWVPAPESLGARALRPVRPPGARAASVGHLCLTLYPSRKDITSGGCPAPLRSCSFVSPGAVERQRVGFEKTSFRATPRVARRRRSSSSGWRPTSVGPRGGPCQDIWVRRCVSVSLGRVGRGGARRRLRRGLRARCPPRPVLRGRRRRAASV